MTAIPTLLNAFSSMQNSNSTPSMITANNPSAMPTSSNPAIAGFNSAFSAPVAKAPTTSSPMPTMPNYSSPSTSMLSPYNMSMQTSTPATLGRPAMPSLSPSPTPMPAPTVAARPAMPSLAATPAPTPSPYMTTPSGAVVNPATGSVVSAGSTPAVPQVGAPNYNSLISSPGSDAAFKQYQGSLVPTQQELDAETNLNNLNTAAAQGYTNTQNQPIALPFITGQQAALQRSQATLAQPLEAQISLLQAKRQFASTASKAALDREDAKLAAARELAKPVNTTYGGTLSRFNPATGQYETVVNPFGSATGTATGSDTGPGGVQDVMGQLAAAGITPTRYSLPGYMAAIKAGVPIQDIVNNKAAVTFFEKPDTQKFIANSNTALNTINDPQQGIKALSNLVNRSNVVMLNNGLLSLKAGVSDPATANFIQQANLLADEVSKLLGSGQGSDFAIQLGQTLVNPSYSQDTFNATMDNLAGRVQNKVNEYVKQGTISSTANSPTSGANSIDPLNLGI